MKYRLVVFDLDGTILDTLRDLTDSVNYALKEHSLPRRSKRKVRAFVGNGIRKLIERAVPSDTRPDVVESVYASFTEHYMVHCADKTKPYRGITALLAALKAKGIKMAVVSNKADGAVNELCERFFPGVFDVVVGERPNVAKKPAPDSLLTVLRELDIPVADSVYIGDSDVDIATAKNAHMDCISVSWGFRREKFLLSCGASRIVSHPDEIRRHVL